MSFNQPLRDSDKNLLLSALGSPELRDRIAMLLDSGAYFAGTYANAAALPSGDIIDGSIAITLNDNVIYVYDFNTLSWVAGSGSGGGVTIGDAVSGGTANYNLYVDASGNVGQEQRLGLTRAPAGTLNQVYIGQGAGTNPAFGLVANANVDPAAAIAYSKLALSNSIVNADINTTAAIARTKVASGTANHVIINDGSGVLSSEAQLSVTRGGTGATAFTSGSIPFSNGTVLTQDNTNLNFDDTNNRLGLGLTTPQNKIHIDAGTATPSNIQFTANATTGQTSTDGTILGISGSADFNLINQESTKAVNILATGSTGSIKIGLNSSSAISVSQSTIDPGAVSLKSFTLNEPLEIGTLPSSTSSGTGYLQLLTGDRTLNGSNSTSGDIYMNTGYFTGTTMSGSTGNVNIASGDISGTGSTATSGSLALFSGSTILGASGSVTLASGNVTNSASTATTGTATLRSGSQQGLGVAGITSILGSPITNASNTNPGGSVRIASGSSTGSGGGGSILMRIGATDVYSITGTSNFTQLTTTGKILLSTQGLGTPSIAAAADTTTGFAYATGGVGFHMAYLGTRFLFGRPGNNIFLGSNSGNGTQTGTENVAVGSANGNQLTDGSKNTVIGYTAGNALTSGTGNTFIGNIAGNAVTTGSNNIVIGREAAPSTITSSNQLVLGSSTFPLNTITAGAVALSIANGPTGAGPNATYIELYHNGQRYAVPAFAI